MSPQSALPLYTVLPFVFMLLSIAVFPLWVPHWWEKNRNKLVVASLLGLPVLTLYVMREPGALVRTAEEYVSFIILLGALYVISGGVHLRGDLVATPLTNTGFLAAGSVLASVVGTTGASMLLIRPLLQTNRERARVKHTVIFFIFTVVEHRRHADPARRPAALPGVSPGRPLHVDVPAMAALAADGDGAAARVLRLGLDAIRAGACRGDSP